MLRRGFTLLELVLVIAIIGGVTAISIPAYRDYQIRSDLNIAAEQITQALGRAQLLSQAGQHGMSWGFSVPQSTLFAGQSYAVRIAPHDERYPIPETIGTSGLSEVWFTRVEGVPSATGTIILTSLRGEQRTVNILIDRKGIAVNTADRLTLCHCQSNPPKTMQLPDNAWPAHRRHGDYLGKCRVPEDTCDD